jgi:predicted metal-binding membrane protein
MAALPPVGDSREPLALRAGLKGEGGFVVGLAAVAAGAWALLLTGQGGMQMSVAPFLVGWTVMMAAMMLPSVGPLAIVFTRSSRDDAAVVALAFGYLLVWVATGFAALAVVRAVNVEMLGPQAVGAIVALAGAYQLTPLKAACLRRCRSPFDFLMQRWRRGLRGAARLGVEHGFYCVGCCWGLMAVLVGAAAMSPAWAASIALIVFVEKALPRGEAVALALGVVAVVAGVAFAIGS